MFHEIATSGGRLLPFHELLAFGKKYLSFLIEERASASIDCTVSRMLEAMARYRAQGLAPNEQKEVLRVVEEHWGDRWSHQMRKMFGLAAPGGGVINYDQWLRVLALYRGFDAKITLPLPQPTEVSAIVGTPTRLSEMVRMRDGVELATDVFLPSGPGPFPVVLTRTPYDRFYTKSAAAFSQDFLVYVVQNTRGRFESGGENIPFLNCGWVLERDGVTTVEWIRRQPWCNGQIISYGASADGITQNLLAGALAQPLKAQYICVAACNLYLAAFTGGAFREDHVKKWAEWAGFNPAHVEELRRNPTYRVEFDNFDTAHARVDATSPCVHLGGWFDVFCQGTIDEFVRRQLKEGESQGRQMQQKLIVGPWTHGFGHTPVGELTFPRSETPSRLSPDRWFDHHLFGIANAVENEPAIFYYVMGDCSVSDAPGNEWRYATRWPVHDNTTKFFLLQDGTLREVEPDGQGSTSFTFDPANPCPTIGGNNLAPPNGPTDQSPIEARPDVCCFTTPELPESIEVTGRIWATVFLSSDARDTDVSVRLSDVYPDGRSYLIAEGMQRVRYRDFFREGMPLAPGNPRLLAPGEIAEVSVDCWSTSIVFNKGHRIRITITSSNSPRFDLNPGTGAVWSEHCKYQIQTNQIHCHLPNASFIKLPVTPATVGALGHGKPGA